MFTRTTCQVMRSFCLVQTKTPSNSPVTHLYCNTGHVPSPRLRLLPRIFLFACLIFLSSSDVPKPATSIIPVQSSLSPVKSHRSSANKCVSGDEPKNENLLHCREFEVNSCCDRQAASMVAQKIEAVYRTKYAACPACVHNLASLQCAVSCDPRQANFVVNPVIVQKGRR